MNLDESQRKKVSQWVAEGLKLSEIQNRLAAELGLRMTYMEVRFLVDDIKLTPKDTEPSQPAAALGTAGATPAAGTRPAKAPAASGAPKPGAGGGAPGGVTVSVDQLTRPGAAVSGKVTFSDGNRADWYLDQTGRLGLVSQPPGYHPPAADLEQFQAALESELSRMGF